MRIPFHPVAELFPLMTGSPFNELVSDIKANGLQVAILTHEGQIIDGRNRYNACEAAGVAPKFKEWDGQGDLVKFVVSLNIHRRHLGESQRAMIAAKLSTRPRGVRKDRPGKTTEFGGLESMTTEEAGSLLNIGVSSIRQAKRLHRDAAPEVIAAVELGEVSVHMAERVIDLPKEDQPAAIAHELGQKSKKKRTAFNPTPADREPTNESIKRRGRGVQLAHEAIAVLKRISPKDELRADGLRIVARWIKDNR